MNDKIETLEVENIEWVPVSEFKITRKERGAKLKVVGGFYRWVVEEPDGNLYMLRPKE